METTLPPLKIASRSSWLDRWQETVADLARLKRTQPMLDAVIDEIDGRMIRVGDQWLADFASCNYLGFDLEPEIIAAIPEHVARWGTHPSWSRLLGSPVLYEQIEQQLAELLGAPDVLALPTITHIHMSGRSSSTPGPTRPSTTAAASPGPTGRRSSGFRTTT